MIAIVGQHMKKNITVWRALLRGRCKQIGLTEASVRDLRRNSWHNKRNDKSWRFVSEALEVPCVTGKIVLADITNAPHVMWTCPHCGEVNYSDLEADASMPALWFCEESAKEELVLVRWKK